MSVNLHDTLQMVYLSFSGVTSYSLYIDITYLRRGRGVRSMSDGCKHRHPSSQRQLLSSECRRNNRVALQNGHH